MLWAIWQLLDFSSCYLDSKQRQCWEDKVLVWYSLLLTTGSTENHQTLVLLHDVTSTMHYVYNCNKASFYGKKHIHIIVHVNVCHQHCCIKTLLLFRSGCVALNPLCVLSELDDVFLALGTSLAGAKAKQAFNLPHLNQLSLDTPWKDWEDFLNDLDKVPYSGICLIIIPI